MRQAVQVFRGGNPFNRLSYFSFAKNHCLYVDGQTISRPTGTDVAGSRFALSRSSGSEATPFNLRRACPFRKSYPDVLMMQPSQDRNGDNGARPLDCSTQGRIFL